MIFAELMIMLTVVMVAFEALCTLFGAACYAAYRQNRWTGVVAFLLGLFAFWMNGKLIDLLAWFLIGVVILGPIAIFGLVVRSLFGGTHEKA